MSDAAELIESIVNVLESMRVPYMIGGSFALAVWASPRTTHDLDLVVDLPESLIVEFCSHFSEDRYFISPDDMHAAFQKRNSPGLGMYSFIDTETGFKVDLFPLQPGDPAQQAALSRRVKAALLMGVTADVYSADELLVQKLRWHAASESERQFQDCLNLVLADLARPTRQIDWTYIEGWATQLGPQVRLAWEAVKRAAGQVSRDVEDNHRSP